MGKDREIPPGIPDKIDITDTLDLHGFFPEQIDEIITVFIQNAVELKIKTVRIVHGKGKSRLKFEVHQNLKHNPAVCSYKDAPPDLGGWGVTIVYLKSPTSIIGSL